MHGTVLEEYIFGCILLLANKLQIWGDGLLDDLTLKQWFLLMLISKMKTENPTIKNISDYSGTSRQNTKKMVEQLAKKEYVRIDKSGGDARALSVSLTNKAWEYFSGNEKKAADSVSRLFSKVDGNDLMATVQTMNSLLEALGHEPLDLMVSK